MDTSPAAITRLLEAWGEGDKAALDALVPLVHKELCRLAGRSRFALVGLRYHPNVGQLEDDRLRICFKFARARQQRVEFSRSH
jgi:hypothetical protein